MKTTILGIEVGKYTIWRFKEYIRAIKEDEADKSNKTGWERGYYYALAISSIREIMIEKKITRKQEKILETFLDNVECKGLRNVPKLMFWDIWRRGKRRISNYWL